MDPSKVLRGIFFFCALTAVGCAGRSARDEFFDTLNTVTLAPIHFDDQPVIDMLYELRRVGNERLKQVGCPCGLSLVVKSDMVGAFRSIDIPETSIFDAFARVATLIDCELEYKSFIRIKPKCAVSAQNSYRAIDSFMRTYTMPMLSYRNLNGREIIYDVWRKANAALEDETGFSIFVSYPQENVLRNVSLDIPATNVLAAFECVATRLNLMMNFSGHSLFLEEQDL